MKNYLEIQANLLRSKLEEKKGDGYVDTGVKILIAIVIGALLLGGLYVLFEGTIMPTVTERIKEMFDYKGQ